MSHSHMPMMHLLKQVELYKARKQQRDNRPAWLVEIINELADLFEPVADVGRVGYECQFEEDQWVVSLFLGSTEIVGGMNDGTSQLMNFQFNALPLLSKFDEIEQLELHAFPDENWRDEFGVGAYLTIAGMIDGNQLKLHIQSEPPHDAGPGLRQFPNGEFNPS